MKKIILSVATVAACAFGGVAHADWIDSVGNTISSIFGVPYDPRPPGAVANIYTDAYGRQYYYGANNQPVYIQQYSQVVPYGTAPGTYALAPSYDRDGDGVADAYDRRPYDARYR